MSDHFTPIELAMRTRSALSGGGEPRGGSPWSDGHAAERQRIAERDLAYWRSHARGLESEVIQLRAALDESSNVRAKMAPQSSHLYEEAKVMRLKARRWHPDNLAELAVLMLRADGSVDGDVDRRQQLFETPWVKAELHRRLEDDRQRCADHLATHAYRPEKFVLAKMALRTSGRELAWQHGMFKHDYSKLRADGKRGVREVMSEGSKVGAPEIFPIREMRALMDEQVRAPDAVAPDRVNVQLSRSAATVRDVKAALWAVIVRVDKGACGGWASDGSEENPHWIVLTMDGGSLMVNESGVRVVMFAGSVEGMNQSTSDIKNLTFWHAPGAAESYETLWANCANARQQLCQIWLDRGLWTWHPDGDVRWKLTHVRFMLTADKSGMAHLFGRRNQNYENFGMLCDCDGHKLYDLSMDVFTHYDHLTYHVRVGRSHCALWDACGQCEEDDYTVYCDCCGEVRHPTTTRSTHAPCHPLYCGCAHRRLANERSKRSAHATR